MNQNTLLITDIQRFSLYDGPGIRTTVFFKGCPLRCPWCSNPETQSTNIQEYKDDGRIKHFGYEITCQDLFEKLILDKPFFGEYIETRYLENMPGGITFSGGETLLQAKHAEPLFYKLRQSKIHMCMETSLFSDMDSLAIASKYIDLFYIDIKLLNKEECKKIINGDLLLYYHNIDYIFTKNIPVVFRIPFIGGYTDSLDNINSIVDFLRHYQPQKVEILKEHALGIKKYKCLNYSVPNYKGVSEQDMRSISDRIKNIGIDTEILR